MTAAVKAAEVMAVGQVAKNTVRIPGIYPCVRSIPVKNKKKLFYFLVWNLNWNWNWDGSWNDLRECQKLWGGLCILYRTYTGGEAPPYNYNTKYTSPLRFFDTPSIDSNLLQMLQNCPQN